MTKATWKPASWPPFALNHRLHPLSYTRDELQRLLAVSDLDISTGAAFPRIRNKAMLLLFIDSGIRRAEIANLKLADLDLESRRVRVVGKGSKVGIAPFCAKTAKALWAWLIERKPRAKT
ncbi:tyrosine-type recombinase/integrase, partial [Chloroflexota bacterium]